MAYPTEGCFIGTMLPQSFLDDFLSEGVNLAPTPGADFTKVLPGGDVTHDMCMPFVRVVQKHELLPGLRLFVARTKKRWNEEKTSRAQDGDQEMPGAAKATFDLCPTMAARKEPTVRGQNKKKSTNIAEYYNFATSLLGIELRRTPEADPFTEPEDYELSRASPLSGQAPDLPPPVSSKANPVSPLSISQRLRRVSPAPYRHDDTLPAAAPGEHTQDGQQSQLHPFSQTSSTGPFRNPVERETEAGTEFRRSLVSHAHAQFARQHRTHFFQLILANRWARFVRWDRSGAVVSSRFDYVHEPAILCEFLWRFAHLSDQKRGLDSTVSLASRQETSLFEDAVKAFLSDMKASSKDGRPMRHLPGAEITLDPSETYPTWSVQVSTENPGEYTGLIVRRPFTVHSSLLGRATRAYIAYDLRERRLVFLKDAWRIDHPKLQAESTTYRYLKQHEVPFIPELLYGGDVIGSNNKPQQTLSQAYADLDEEWCRYEGSFERYIHHRVVQDVAYPLGSALDEREFLQAIHDSLCAISSAYDVAGVLHRDLSMENIMLDTKGRGILNDWDHAGNKDSRARGIGTWRFMSLCLLENPTKIHDVADDLESVFWVMTYGSLKRFARSNQAQLMRFFDYQTVDPENGQKVGGQLKEGCIFGPRLRNIAFTSDSLQDLIHKAKLTWFGYYTILQGNMDLDSSPLTKGIMLEQHEQAKRPAFWVDLFAKALHAHDARQLAAEQTTPVLTKAPEAPTLPSPRSWLKEDQPETSAQENNNKRKACDDLQEPGVRRSKRLKGLRG
ncbi:hypothetical protein PHLGIDRAFT_122872 [Phlebiopsis gigantea 11061_1 CR5-6]|uniref:Fungal-type protein kinase domain-containing protein n=1 Tax=Phlebiopsis gigantea (strain 11061_1 CR5-6) TaxID=745531 RepID=A0A0C3RZP0_PHLG1|nr:hypothetical protein PHLGIDRAFT_122872 [Phlebiopsis gigantea 11061_1 CR5-6]